MQAIRVVVGYLVLVLVLELYSCTNFKHLYWEAKYSYLYSYLTAQYLYLYAYSDREYSHTWYITSLEQLVLCFHSQFQLRWDFSNQFDSIHVIMLSALSV